MRAPVSRREFLQLSALAASASGLLGSSSARAESGATVALVVAPDDRLAAAPCVGWAIRELRQTLESRGARVSLVGTENDARAADLMVIVSGSAAPIAAAILRSGRRSGSLARRSRWHWCQPHERDDPCSWPAVRTPADSCMRYSNWRTGRGTLTILSVRWAIRSRLVERPFNAVRAIGRPFVSDVEDKPWFTIASSGQRISACSPASVSTGSTWPSASATTRCGMSWTPTSCSRIRSWCPFPATASGPCDLPDDERDRNLEMLRFISREAAAHGIDFQLGLWTHGYVWDDSPNANYTIDGLTPGEPGRLLPRRARGRAAGLSGHHGRDPAHAL